VVDVIGGPHEPVRGIGRPRQRRIAAESVEAPQVLELLLEGR
jgi:hypothetical protein